MFVWQMEARDNKNFYSILTASSFFTVRITVYIVVQTELFINKVITETVN